MPRPEALRIVRRRPSTAWIRSCVRYVNQRASRAGAVGPLGGPVVGRRRARRHHDDQRPDAVPQDQEVQARGDVERVDECGARIARRPVQEIGDREAQPRLPAVGGRQVDERTLRPPAQRGAVEGQRGDPPLLGGRHRRNGRSEAAVEHVVVHVAREEAEPERRHGDGERRHREPMRSRRPGPGGRHCRHPPSIPCPVPRAVWTIDRTDRPPASSDRMMPRPCLQSQSTIGPCPGSV